ncbi:VC_2705 family sodium/solute symporter [Chitinasiproducens palmae]|uniref:Cation/acetate symporter n=1 Tax=Chitinasiproducens palmae TaxID=1770053 RepID=A0A1H2PQE0_9BURK|nr:VC_2705 family sodium/solute symporter [Chitinasiproducens palmae]SDV49043.1 cation/acetate symporter [Chitinasiproducens palmae]
MSIDGAASRRLARRYLLFAVGLAAFIAGVAQLERLIGAGDWIGVLFLSATLMLYAVIGLCARTADLDEYYVAGRRVPAVFNGMATAADWLSAASFVGIAGYLIGNGRGGLVYLLGWTGGFCLVAVLLAPYIRKLGRYTIPDFLAARYPGVGVRAIAIAATMICSFIYLIAQIQGVGLIASRFVGVDFGIGIFFGLAGILVCSFLGGMRAVTWTQVAQCLVLLSAILLPTSLLGQKLGLGPVPQFNYGSLVERLGRLETQLAASPVEKDARAALQARADLLDARLAALPGSYEAARRDLAARIAALHAAAADAESPDESVRERYVALRARLAAEEAEFPPDPRTAAERWRVERAALLARMVPPRALVADRQTDATAGASGRTLPNAAIESNRRANFVALLICLTLGTASLPHVLTRFATATSVSSARSAVAWTLGLVGLFYLTVPVLAVMVKFELLSHLLGSSLDALPAWTAQWRRLETPMIAVEDVLGDGRVHWAGLRFDTDMILLASPEIGGLPAYVSGLVAAGALAAALSTADGLLLTIANVLSHDVYFHLLGRRTASHRRVIVSKLLLLAVALLAAWLATRNLGNILFLVGAAFSLAASSLFPALVLGVFWRRTSPRAATAAMTAGLGVCAYYIATTYPPFAHLTGFLGPRWFGIDPSGAGVFGVSAGFAVAVIGTLCDPQAGKQAAVADAMRLP